MGQRKRKSPIRKGERDAVTRERRLRFAREYLVDRNGLQAAIRAGYGKASAKRTACRNLQHPEVKAFIEAAEAKIAAKLEITAERVLAEFARIAFSDIRTIFDAGGALKGPDELADDAALAIGSVEVRRERGPRGTHKDGSPREEEVVKVKLHDKLRALEALAKHTGVLKEPPAAPGTVMWQLDPEKLATMTDAQIDAAIASAKLLTGAA